MTRSWVVRAVALVEFRGRSIRAMDVKEFKLASEARDCAARLLEGGEVVSLSVDVVDEVEFR